MKPGEEVTVQVKSYMTRKGIYHGRIRHTVKHWRKPGAVQMALVTFRRNRKGTRVPYASIIKSNKVL